MQGYRQALNLSYMLETEGANSSQMTCSFEDDVETSAIVVRVTLVKTELISVCYSVLFKNSSSKEG